MEFVDVLLLATVATAQVIRWIVWGGLVALTVALLVLTSTSWGQSNPLRKCIVLSTVAHLLIGIYATTVNIITHGGGGGGSQPPVSVAILSSAEDIQASNVGTSSEPWNGFATSTAAVGTQEAPAPDHLVERATAEPDRATSNQPTAVPSEITAARIGSMATEEPTLPGDTGPTALPKATSKAAEPIESSQAERSSSPTDNLPGDLVPPPPVMRDTGEGAGGEGGQGPVRSAPEVAGPKIAPLPIDHVADGGQSLSPSATSSATDLAKPAASAAVVTELPLEKVPAIYQERLSPNRGRVAEAHGGSKDTEAAVAAALRWLARQQSPDGRWHASNFEAGREVMINGHDRRGAGSHADTGITGLCLLAFLASGNTHLQGEHAVTVRRGAEFLLRVQAPDGSLFGDATMYEKMYCHAMATFALSEDYAMTRDDRMRQGVRAAVGYCIAAQDRHTGGWRYQSGDPGDTSQLGWQVMALKSAELAGVQVPESTRDGIARFLRSVASGRNGGLASYRPGHATSRPMTAEALLCRQFMGLTKDSPAAAEAGNYLMQELPGRGQTNVYYWYYATLAMYQMQGEYWERWNEALQNSLLSTQRLEGDLAGSWDPDAAWGAYGGRAYSTALSTLCLEVYYRFLPLYVEAATREKPAK